MPTLFSRFALILKALFFACFMALALSGNAFANARPELLPIPEQSISTKQVFVYRLSATDADGTIPGIRMLNAPAGAKLEDNGDGSRTLRWQPPTDLPAQTVIIFQAFDANDSSIVSTQRMLLRRNDTLVENDTTIVEEPVASESNSEANRPPQLPSIGIQLLRVNHDYQLYVRSKDADGTVPSLTVAALPEGAVLEDAHDGSRVFRWRPSVGQEGEHRVTFLATDALDTSLTSERVIVFNVQALEDPVSAEAPVADDVDLAKKNENNEPYIEAISSPVVSAGQDITFRVVPRMPDMSAAILHVDRLPPNASFADNYDGTRTFRWSTTEADQGEHIFRFTAIHHDNVNQRVSTEVLVIVGDSNAPDSKPEDTTGDNGALILQPIEQQTVVVNNVVSVDSESAVPPPNVNVGTRPINRAQAARFLQRATFGPNDSSVSILMQQTYADWINDQMSVGQTRYLDSVDSVLREYGLFNITDGRRQFDRQQIRSDAFWNIAVNAPDQLRQRVAFALGQILVVSDKDAGLDNRVRGIANYHDLLASEAFGNYRTLLGKVTLNPMMGDFLSMRRNEKPDIENNIQSDENYAREMMQLFTLGLSQLQSNGQPVIGNNGQAVPTYTQDDVVNLAQVLTGWNYGDAGSMRTSERSPNSEIIPMKAFEEFHDTSEKKIVGNVEIPSGLSASAELEFALDSIFNHPNVPPFVSRQLIQRLVTSNPSADYIQRVAAVFADNGAGVRGDLSAVVPAILLDDEALNGDQQTPWSSGKLKEPVIKIASIWRAFAAKGAYGKLRYSGINADFLQNPYSAPSVFNYYSANYKPPGPIGNEGKLAPEAQILNDTTVLRAADRLFDYAHAVPLGSANNSNQHAIVLNLDAEKALANRVPALVEHLTDKLLAGVISDSLRSTLLELGEATPMTDNGEQRVRELLYVLFISPEFSVQR